jgi:hypothetical protein
MTRKLFVLLFFILFTGCRSYTKIDGKNWDSHTHAHKDWIISYELPKGYVVNSLSDGNSIDLGSYHYDVLTGTGIYGSPWGETTISFFVSDHSMDDTIVLISKTLEGEQFPCIEDKTREWHKIICERPAKSLFAEHYVIQLHKNEFLHIVAGVGGRAYRKKGVFNNRKQMLKDIVEKVSVERM